MNEINLWPLRRTSRRPCRLCIRAADAASGLEGGGAQGRAAETAGFTPGDPPEGLSSLSLRQVAAFLLGPAPPLVPPSAGGLLSWRRRWLPSAAASPSAGQRQHTQTLDLNSEPERPTLLLTRLLALIFLVSTRLSAVIFLMFS